MIDRSPQVSLERGETLAEVLTRLKEKSGKSQAEISRGCWLDESYLSRLFSGEKANPSRDVIILVVGYGMRLAVEDTDEALLATTDYRPIVPLRTIR
jgi:hypothetical protein